MYYLNKLNLSVIASITLALGALAMPFSGQAQMAGKMQFTDRSDGGVNIQFKNGCFIWYNQYASRGGNTGGCTDQQFFRADEAANSRLNGNAGGASSGSGNSVSEGQMQKFCQGEASAELGINPRDISTRPVEKTNSGRFIVWGQSPPYGSNVTTFACGFDSRGRFQKVEVKSWADSNGGNTSTGAVPEGQMQKYCQGEASAELGVNPRDISTRPVEKTNSGRFIVWGQSPPYGSNVTTFGCGFDSRGRFQKVEVKSWADSNGGNTSTGAVPEGQMQKFCQGEASAELGVNPRDISTRPVEKTNSGRFIVWGQSPPYGSNVTTFACGFDSRGRFQKVEVKSRPNDGWNPSNGNSGNTRLPGAAESRCREVFGASSDITEVSPLRPGYWEVILQARSGRRMAACTVASNGDIQNWVELN